MYVLIHSKLFKFYIVFLSAILAECNMAQTTIRIPREGNPVKMEDEQNNTTGETNSRLLPNNTTAR